MKLETISEDDRRVIRRMVLGPSAPVPLSAVVGLDASDPAIADAIVHTLHAAYRIEAQIIGAAAFPPLRRSAGDIAASPGEFFGRRAGERLAGVIELERQEGATVIASLGVDPHWFGQGIGRSLVRHALTLAPGPVRASTGRDNAPALRLYHRLGFAVVGQDVTPEGIHLVHLQQGRRA